MNNSHDDVPADHEHQPRPIGELLDKLGVETCIHDGDFVSDVVVVFKVLDTNGVIKVGMAASKNIQSYDLDAMLRKAADYAQFRSSR